MIVGEARAVVTVDAIRLADEEPETCDFVRAQAVGARMRLARALDGDVAVEARLTEGDRALEGRDRLAHVRVDDRLLGAALQLRQGAEDPLVVLSIVCGDVAG